MCRVAARWVRCSQIWLGVVPVLVLGLVGSPRVCNHLSCSVCVFGVVWSVAVSWYTQSLSPRVAVMVGSFCRSDPEAAFLVFT